MMNEYLIAGIIVMLVIVCWVGAIYFLNWLNRKNEKLSIILVLIIFVAILYPQIVDSLK